MASQSPRSKPRNPGILVKPSRINFVGAGRRTREILRDERKAVAEEGERCQSSRPAAALLSRGRPDLARRLGPDVTRRRSFRADRLRIALFCGARLEPGGSGDDCLRYWLHLRASSAGEPTGQNWRLSCCTMV